jgi:divalent metal cation (Fe/Co/Zn/Cd) transporter
VRAVLLALAVLGATAAAQTLVFVASGSVALLADLIHNLGDASTAIPSASHSPCAVSEPSAGPAGPSC